MKSPHAARKSKALPATTETWQKQINNNKLFFKEGLYTGFPGIQICKPLYSQQPTVCKFINLIFQLSSLSPYIYGAEAAVYQRDKT